MYNISVVVIIKQHQYLYGKRHSNEEGGQETEEEEIVSRLFFEKITLILAR